MTIPSLKEMDQVQALVGRLKHAPTAIRSAERHGRSADEEAWQVATALADIEESANELFGDLVPKLLGASWMPHKSMTY